MGHLTSSYSGSGEIAIAVKTEMLVVVDHEIIAVLSNNVNGQLGLKLKNCKNKLLVGIVGFISIAR